MKFEEEFPSLKGLEQYTEYLGEINYTKEDVEKHCLDKKKVKEAIKIVCEKDNDGSIFYAMELLEKELKNNGT